MGKQLIHRGSFIQGFVCQTSKVLFIPGSEKADYVSYYDTDRDPKRTVEKEMNRSVSHYNKQNNDAHDKTGNGPCGIDPREEYGHCKYTRYTTSQQSKYDIIIIKQREDCPGGHQKCKGNTKSTRQYPRDPGYPQLPGISRFRPDMFIYIRRECCGN